MNDKIAYHEAGHFVVGNILGSSAEYGVTIEPEGDALGRCLGEFPLGPSPTVNEVENACTMLYAGFAAQVQFDPSMEEQARVNAADDDDEASRFLRLITTDASATGEIEKKYRKRAARLVKNEWPAIERLARELLLHKTVPADVAETLIDIVHGRATEQDLDNLRALRTQEKRNPSGPQRTR